jgi:hypothetical protein
MFKIKKFQNFLQENHTFADLNYDPSILNRLEALVKSGTIAEFWFDEETDIPMPNEEGVLEKGPVLRIKIELDDHIYTFDQFDESAVVRLLNNLENHSIHIPRENIESIKEVMLLIKDGWELYHINENRSDFIFKYTLDEKQKWLLGLMFRKLDDKIHVRLRSTYMVKGSQGPYTLEKYVDESECLSTMKKFLVQFYEYWSDYN